MLHLKSARRGSRNGVLVILIMAASAIVTGARAATVQFQGVSYDVSIITLAPAVPALSTNDLIFVNITNGPKVLALPTDVTVRGTFDQANQLFYMLNKTTGEIDGFSNINATLVNLDGTVFNTITQAPTTGLFGATGAQPQDLVGKPLAISQSGVDVCIVNSFLIGYRTDGPLTGNANVYTISHQAGSTVQEQFAVPLLNADPFNNNLSVFIEYDKPNNTYLLSQVALDATLNTDTRDRISAFNRDGTLADQLILTNNSVLPTYAGGAEGITEDPVTGTIYLLALTNSTRQIFVFTPQVPALLTVKPATGSVNGGDTVTLTGTAILQGSTIFFDGIPATNITVTINSSSVSVIQATTPAHAAGPVNITVTGPGIDSATPLLLANGFTYIQLPPTAQLSASPTQGLPALAVLFSSAGTVDNNGTIIARVISFGDGTTFTFPTDLSVTQTTHNYLTAGTFTATLTVTDNAGNTASATQIIVVGADAPMVLRMFSVQQITSNGNGTVKLQGEIVLPSGLNLSSGTLILGLLNPSSGALAACSASFMDTSDFNGNVTGGEFCGTLNGSGTARGGTFKFSIKPLKKPGFADGTNTFILSGSAGLAKALNNAVVNLKFDANGIALTSAAQNQKRLGEVLVVLRLSTTTQDTLQFRKLAVVDINPVHNSTIKLSRK